MIGRPSKYFPALLFAQLLFLPAPAEAQPNARDKAAAETLFQHATELMDSGRFAEACEKFEASEALEHAIGTMLRLADCYDRVGRSASAWALFRQVAELSRSDRQPEREAIASARARDLARRLSHLRLSVGRNENVQGLTIELNGSIIPRASWDLPLPVDPGLQKLRVFAPGHEPWSTSVEVPSKGTSSIAIPPLRAEPEQAIASPLAPPQPSGATPRRVMGYVAGGVGLVGVGTALILGYRAYDLNQESLTQCSSVDANACTPAGKGFRDDAASVADTATVFGIAGGVLLATGITLILTAPSAASSNRAVSIRAIASPDRANLTLTSSF